jgi:DNA-binding response OmpR family regulator
MVVNNLKIDTNKRQVYKAGERIPLTGVEYSLLELLMSYPGKSFTRREILQQVCEVMRCKAQELGQKIRDEDGVANAVEVFHRHLGLIG